MTVPVSTKVGMAPPTLCAILELMHCVMMQVIQKLQSVIAHHVRLLRHRSRNHALFNPIQGRWIVVKRNDRQLAIQIESMDCFRRARTAGCLQTDDPVDFSFFCIKSAIWSAALRGSPLSSRIFVIFNAGKFDNPSTAPASRSSTLFCPSILTTTMFDFPETTPPFASCFLSRP